MRSLWQRRKPIAILGCGPAGIFAAHAIALAGQNPFWIFSNPRKSDMFGAQYLHFPIPGLSRKPSFTVDYQLQGSAEGYRDKVYHDASIGVSPENILGKRPAWDIRDAYDHGYELYHSRIKDEPNITGDTVQEILREFHGRVISTIPLPALCLSREIHQFPSATVYAIGDAPERGVSAPISAPANTVICNGNPEPAWYRASTILGYSTVEWPGSSKPPYDGVATVVKPIRNTCTCHPGMFRLGRYGTWTKGVLSHESYFTVAREYR